MHDGWEHVAAAYAVTAITLGAWFVMMLRKLARLKRDAQERADG